MMQPMNYVRQTDFSEVSRFHLSHNKLWRKLNRLRSEKYGSLKAGILRYHGYISAYDEVSGKGACWDNGVPRAQTNKLEIDVHAV